MQKALCICAKRRVSTHPVIARSAATSHDKSVVTQLRWLHPPCYELSNVFYVKCWIIFSISNATEVSWTAYINRSLTQTKGRIRASCTIFFQILKLMLRSKWLWIDNNEITTNKQRHFQYLEFMYKICPSCNSNPIWHVPAYQLDNSNNWGFDPWSIINSASQFKMHLLVLSFRYCEASSGFASCLQNHTELILLFQIKWN